MRNEYSLNLHKNNDSVIDQLLILMTAQARISSRRRSNLWEVRVRSNEAIIGFKYKPDLVDFEEAFEAANKTFLKEHGLIAEDCDLSPQENSLFMRLRNHNPNQE